MVTVVLIRHGTRQEGPDGPYCPLSELVFSRATQLGTALVAGHYAPRVFVSSSWLHTTQTAAAIRDVAAPDASLITADSLTPHTKTNATLHDITAQIASVVDLSRCVCFACVGHEPRIGQLIEDLTGQKLKKLNYAEARVVHAASFDQLLNGEGQLSDIHPLSIPE